MKHPLKSLAMAILAAGSLFATPVVSEEPSPVGKWQTSTGESRYEVSLCGDGTRLCAKLTWLRSDARTAENVKYLNKYVVHGAKPLAPNKWRGTVNYAGEKIAGSVTLVAPDKMRLNSCMLVVCQSIDFHRI